VNVFLWWLLKERGDLLKLTEKISIFVLFLIFCFAFNVTSIYLNSSSMNMDSLYDGVAANEAGSLYNKLYWSALFVLSLWGVILNKKEFSRKIKAVVPVLLLCALLLVSVFWSDYPVITLRRVALVIFVVFSIMISVFYIEDRRRIVLTIYKASVVALALNIGVLLLGLGFDDNGLFSGIHGHKNTAGLVSVVGLWITLVAREYTKRLLITNSLYIAGWLVILILSQSKTSILLLLVSPLLWIGVVMMKRLFKAQLINVMIISFLFFFFTAQLLVVVNGMTNAEFISSMGGDVSLTGRDFIWSFVWEYISQRPVFGVGYGAFWDVGEGASNLGSSEHGRIYMKFIHQAHNGYLDILVSVGGLGLFLVGNMVFKIFNALNKEVSERNRLANFSGVLMIFILLHNITESSLLRTTHLNWVMLLVLFFIFKTTNDKLVK